MQVNTENMSYTNMILNINVNLRGRNQGKSVFLFFPPFFSMACQNTEMKTNLWAHSVSVRLINKYEYLMLFLSLNSLQCFLKNILTFALRGCVIFQRHSFFFFRTIYASCKHAVLQSLLHISISPDRPSSSSH